VLGQDVLVTEDVTSLLRSLPKVDLHAHLTGSLRPATVAELAGDPRASEQLRLPSQLKRYSDLFAPWNGVLARVPDTPATVHRMLLEVAEDFAADGVRYAEIRVSARRPLIGGYFREWLHALADAAASAQSRYDFSTGLVLGFAHQRFATWADEERCGNLLLEMLSEDRHLVVGLDLWGDESSRPNDAFADWLRQARCLNFPVSLHIGEVGFARSLVAGAILRLHPDRISHGPALSNSPGVLRALEDNRILTEVCLTSNEITQPTRSRPTVDRASSQLIKSAAPFAICTDDPSIFGITLSGEMGKALLSGLVTVDDLAKSMHDAIKSSFASTQFKESLSRELNSPETRHTMTRLRSLVAGSTSSWRPGR
jgi:adenosine deaminase